MPHAHDVIDADIHYKIDGVSRIVVNVNETKKELVQYDHKSERFTFELPRYVDGHDFADCNATQIHYENKDVLGKNASADIYDVNDLHVKADDENTVVLSWLVEDTATQYVGTLGFSIRFMCVVDGVTEYAWGTKWFDGISIVQGMCLSEKVEKEHSDAIANLSAAQKDLANKVDDVESKVQEAEAKIIGKKGTGQNSEVFNDTRNVASGNYSHAEGDRTSATGKASHAEGCLTAAKGDQSHAEGDGSVAYTVGSHAEGFSTKAGGKSDSDINTHNGNYAHSEGVRTIAYGYGSHAEGEGTLAQNQYSHAEGGGCQAAGDYSHAEGCSHGDIKVTASGKGSHAEGMGTQATGEASHAEGRTTHAEGLDSHAEGRDTYARGNCSHAEGMNSEANNGSAHAEGYGNIAGGDCSHAEGNSNQANGSASHVEGLNNFANGNYQHVQGKYNVPDNANKYAHIVGGGSSNSNRKNIHTVDWAGCGWFAGGLKVGGSSQDDPNAKSVLTSADMQTIIDAVIAAIPIYEGEVEAV